MKKEEAKEILSRPFNMKNVPQDILEAHRMAIEALEQEPTTKNNLGVDCISRQSVLDKIQRLIDAEQNNIDENGDYMNYARERVNAYEAIQFFVENDCLCPSVTPQEPRCRECKWWKDSDGKYRRGIGAESRCPINTHAVYSGEGYCYMFSPKIDMRGEE